MTKEALAQPEHEWVRGECVKCGQSMERPEQETVAWISKHGVVYPLDAKDEVHPINELQPLYTTPPQRTWVGLTDEEIARVVSLAGFAPNLAEAHIATQIVRVLEAKLKEKNT